MPVSTQRSRFSRNIAAWIATLGLSALAFLLAVLAWRVDPVAPNWVSFALVSALFAGAIALPFHLEVRQQGISVAATELALLLALFYLPPLWLLVARCLAGSLIYGYRYVRRQTSFIKAVFNIATSMIAFACASFVAAGFGIGSPVDPSTWITLLLAITVSNVVSAAGLVGMMLIIIGPHGADDIAKSLGTGIIITGINCAIGLVILAATTHTVWTLVPLTILIGVLIWANNGYSKQMRQRRSLTDLNEFTQSVSQAVQSNRLVDIMTHRLRSMLHAEAATVWVPADKRFPELLLSAYMDVEGLLDTSPVPAQLREYVVATGEPLIITSRIGTDEHRALLRESKVKDAILVPLRSGTVSFGCIAATNRLGGELTIFGEDELTLLETLAAHASVAVENSRLVDRLRFDAYHDSLTRLPNRRRIMNVIEESISITVPGEIVAVMLFDVDGMRDINDSVGHAAGDDLIVEFGRRIREAAPAAAHVGRIDGDEFALVIRLPDTAAAIALAAQMRDALQQPCMLGALNVDIDSAVGIAIHPDTGDKADTLLQRADVATQSAKSIVGGIQVYNSGLESTSVRRIGLAGDLRRAFDNGEFSVHFQPKVALADRTIVGVECLARWRHPTHGDVPPEDFIPVAEHTGQLGALTTFVLREGLSRIADWAQRGHELGISVNLSPRTLADAQFPRLVESLLAEYDLAPERLTLELTEDGMVGGGERTPRTLDRLRELGVRLSVDDFGKGYSSLAYLRRLPVQEIKIDRGFVQGMATDRGDYAIVRAVVDLARHFNMSVVAEGVESEMTLQQLSEIGCDVAQGFYFSRPLTADRFDAWLAAQHGDGAGPRRLHAV
ncbi:putative bifunctional diguanylate cyclase/phosphodiesterase [Stackebrandtia soli]|uniref:putative bifunctional diguanylate cyclase/phosphodiesterase n=1 Tax=Stackebrandtia soli TaxID=1892856 RepID=UPI0039EB901E